MYVATKAIVRRRATAQLRGYMPRGGPRWGIGAYDPAVQGPPTWMANGSGTAKTMEEFEQQRQQFLTWNVEHGLIAQQPGTDTYTNTVAFAPGLPTPDDYRAAAREATAAGATGEQTKELLKQIAAKANEVEVKRDELRRQGINPIPEYTSQPVTTTPVETYPTIDPGPVFERGQATAPVIYAQQPEERSSVAPVLLALGAVLLGRALF